MVDRFVDPIKAKSIREYLGLDTNITDIDLYNASRSYLPEYELAAISMIKQRLGYIPATKKYKWHELYIRQLLHIYFNRGFQSNDELHNAVDIHIKHIRNADLHEVVNPPVYSQDDMKEYDSFMLEYKELSQQKIASLLGYIPDPRYSLQVELLHREFLSTLKPSERDKITQAEYRIIGAIKYREYFLNLGLEAAQTSPLMGHAWDNPIFH
ncbi:hypothetical protein ACFQ21_12865 [Ohtaekwangia kribbensis]|uniref:Uncharacterized protein n=1 Tax=Ohtaekwangia kribbensis TaxID=688913 RepID=A0ABW3K342_9BACT